MKSKNALIYKDKLISVGLKIGYVRRQKGLTQEQLAEKAGISVGFLSQVEAPNMYMGISLATLFALADALDVPASTFLEF